MMDDPVWVISKGERGEGSFVCGVADSVERAKKDAVAFAPAGVITEWEPTEEENGGTGWRTWTSHVDYIKLEPWPVSKGDGDQP